MTFLTHIKPNMRGLVFRDDTCVAILQPGWHLNLRGLRSRVEQVSVRQTQLDIADLNLVLEMKQKPVDLRALEVSPNERAFVWIDREFQGIYGPGKYAFWTTLRDVRIEQTSVTKSRLNVAELEVLQRALPEHDELRYIDVVDGQRALVWIDQRFTGILTPGLYAYWTVIADIKVEMVDISDLRFTHSKLKTILENASAKSELVQHIVPTGYTGLLIVDGEITETLNPGTYVYWNRAAKLELRLVDRRESVVDISGQDIMTSDKVTLRLNALVTYKVADVRLAVDSSEDFQVALYRAAQMVLREVIGTRDLDELLADRDDVTQTLDGLLRERTNGMGLEIIALGIRDLILPGEMKTLLNRVTEARKAAEASLITRREETASMRSQANTAKILDSNPTLMRLRELEVVENIADKAKLNVVLGDTSLTDRLTHLV